jgi:hypothetical protein
MSMKDYLRTFTPEGHEEANRRWVVMRLSSVVCALAEKRHEARKHEGEFSMRTEATCANVHEAYLAL